MGGKTNEAFVEVELDELPPPPDYNTIVAEVGKGKDGKKKSEPAEDEKKEKTPQLPPASFVQLVSDLVRGRLRVRVNPLHKGVGEQ